MTRLTTGFPTTLIWTRRDFWVGLALGTGVPLTALTGLVVGWLAVALQFFGERADADDYRTAAGAYGAAAVLLVLGALAVWTYRAPRWILVVALGAAAVLALLSLASVARIPGAEPGPGINHWWDGAGGVLACPWTWPLLALGLLGPIRGRRPGAGRT